MRRHLTLAFISIFATVGLGACSSADTDKNSATIRDEKGVVTVVATDLKFDEKEYTATAGKVRFRYIDNGAIPHTLLIEGIKGFKMEVTVNGSVDDASADLKPGTYTMYCDVVGHRAAGMHAKLIVTPPPTTSDTFTPAGRPTGP